MSASRKRTTPRASKAVNDKPFTGYEGYAPGFEGGAKFARSYFGKLTTDPTEACLQGDLGDLVTHAEADSLAGPDDRGAIVGFGRTLQALLVKALQKRPEQSDETGFGEEASTQGNPRGDLDTALLKLACVRDLVHMIEEGNEEFFCFPTLGMFAHSTLCDAGTEIEQALDDLGLLVPGKDNGWFLGGPLKSSAKGGAA